MNNQQDGAVFGKWHLSAEPKDFDYFKIYNDQGEYYNPKVRTYDSKGIFNREKGYATELVTDDALTWLDKNKDSGKPFCLMICHKAPHGSWMPRLKEINLYEDRIFPEPSTLFDDYSSRGNQMKEQEPTIANDMGYAFDFKVPELKDEPTHKYINDSYELITVI